MLSLLKTQTRVRACALAVTCVFTAAACDDSDDTTDASNAADAGGGNDAGPGDNDAGPEPVSQWIVGSWLLDPDGDYNGSLMVADDLGASGSLDFDNAAVWPADFTYSSPGNGTVFVGREDMPVIERWAINDDGQLENTLDEPLDLSAYGVTSTMGRSQPVIQFVDETHAYYIDNENFKVIVFNPQASPMTVYPDDGFSLGGLDVAGQGEDLGSVFRSGDRIFVTGRYWDEVTENTTNLVKTAIIDVTNGSVTYAQSDRCGLIGAVVDDDEGNLYFGSHPGLSVGTAAGWADENTPPACIVRIKAGEDEFDADYFVNLDEISDGKLVGSLMPGADNHAYVMQYAGSTEVTSENSRTVLWSGEWDAYVLDLHDAESTYAKLEGFPKAVAYGSGFRTTVGTERVTYLIYGDPSGNGGAYYDVSNPISPVKALEFEKGGPGGALPVH